MFIGHFAAGFALKRAAPRVSLVTLCAAAQWPDIVWPVLVAAGVERVAIAPGDTAFTPLAFLSYPWSHSLLLVILWAAAFALVYFFRARDGRAAALLGGLVVSHWLLDYITHRPDLPIYPGGPHHGLGLWNSIPATLAVEGGIFALGVWLYVRSTRPRHGRRQYGLMAFVTVLLLGYTANLSSVPPSVSAIWIGAIAGFAVLFALAAWADRARQPIG